MEDSLLGLLEHVAGVSLPTLQEALPGLGDRWMQRAYGGSDLSGGEDDRKVGGERESGDSRCVPGSWE